MVYFGCAAVLQITVIVLVSIALLCSLRAWYADFLWTREFERIKDIFNKEEKKRLQRFGQYIDIPYLALLLIVDVIITAHTVLCFTRQDKRFHKNQLSKQIFLFGGICLTAMTLFPMITAAYNDAKYSAVEKRDTRIYLYTTKFQNGTLSNRTSFSVFHYCHFGNGQPIHWSRIKGIRMKKYGSNICQKIGMRYFSAFFTCYAGILYLCVLKALDSRRRDKIAEHVAMMFDLFGDIEEAAAEHPVKEGAEDEEDPTLTDDLEGYKRRLLRSSFRDTKLPPKLEAWLETGKYDEEPDSALLPIPVPNVYTLSPFAHENIKRGVPDYLVKIQEARMETKLEVEEAERAEREQKEAANMKKSEWRRQQQLKSKIRQDGMGHD